MMNCLQLIFVEFRYVSRNCNKDAHSVALFVFKEGSSNSWFEFELEWLFSTLTADVNVSVHI